MDYILNLTQHIATPEQKACNVVEPDNETKKYIQQTLTFDSIPRNIDIELAARVLAGIANEFLQCDKVMIGGAPYLMSALERELKEVGKRPVYAYSERVSEDQRQTDGTVKKVSIFKHIGFVEV